VTSRLTINSCNIDHIHIDMSLSSPSPPSSSSSPLFALPPYSTTSPSRFQALYSDFFRQRNSNPTSFHSNVEWWRKALETLVGSGFQDSNNRLVLNAGRSLMERVKVPRVGKPLALGAVIVRPLMPTTVQTLTATHRPSEE
jgi:charged multivesicular body protein 7